MRIDDNENLIKVSKKITDEESEGDENTAEATAHETDVDLDGLINYQMILRSVGRTAGNHLNRY